MPDFTLLFYAINQLSWWNWAKWVMLIVITFVLARALFKQNIKHAAFVADQGQNQLVLSLLHLAKSRGHVALMLWSLLCIIIVYRDVEMQINSVKNGAHSLTARSASITPVPPAPSIQEPANQALVIEKNSDATSQTTLDDTKEKQLNSIKASYEDAFVSYLILDGCKQSNIREYESLYLALLKALKPYDSTGREAGNIIIAASGSYQALYRNAPCAESYLSPVKQNFSSFMNHAKQD